MGYTFGFADNEAYGASDVNSVIGKIVTSGVADVFFDGLNYNTSDLNKIAETLVEDGVLYGSGGSMKVIEHADGVVRVSPGTAFFSDGACVTSDTDGVNIEYTRGQKNYIYIQNKLLSDNTIEFVCSLTGGASGTIPLAEIDSSGAITDTRVFCKGKAAGYQSDFRQPKIIEVEYNMPSTTKGYSTYTAETDIGTPIYSRVIDCTALTDEVSHIGICDLTTNKYFSSINDGGDCRSYRDKFIVFRAPSSRYIYMTVTLSAKGILTCSFTTNTGGENPSRSGTVKLLLV